MKNILRLFQILSIVLIYALPLKLLGNKGKRLSSMLQRLGPFFVKFGQTLATRPDLIGEELASDLSELHDRLTPYRNKNIVSYIKRELGRPINKLFKEFDLEPVATASIAVVFKAIDMDGNEVAVKVLKPGVEAQFKRDISLMFLIARILNKYSNSMRRLRLVEIVKIFESTTTAEMDFRLEAAAAAELRENHKLDTYVYIPKIYWDKTSHKILTLEWINGTPIYMVDKLKESGYDLDKIVENVTFMFLNQAYRDGFFHADLHPGNVMVIENNRIALIDFGIMGRLDKKTKMYLAEILHGFSSRNYYHVAKVHFLAGYVKANQSLHAFAQACRAIGEPIIGVPANQISIGKLLTHLFKVTKDFEMETQPQLLLVQKTTVVVEGLAMKLNPNTNLWQIAESWIKTWASKNLKLETKVKSLLDTGIDFLNKDFRNFILEGTKYFKALNRKQNEDELV